MIKSTFIIVAVFSFFIAAFAFPLEQAYTSLSTAVFT
jgi:hypothetical protein